MNDALIRAYLWQEVLNKAFHLASSRDQKNWLRQYGQSLHAFWETDSYPLRLSEDGGKLIGNMNLSGELNLLLDFAIESNGKFSIQTLYPLPNGSVDFLWMHDVDDRYFCLSHNESAICRGVKVQT